MSHIRIVHALWGHLDDSEEGRNGEVTIRLTREQAQELYQLYWNCSSKWRKALKDFGWSPDPTPPNQE